MFMHFFPGYLSAPAVTITHNKENNSLLFSWSAPFTLNISDVEPDILYYYIIVIDDISRKRLNTTDTHYLLQSQTCLFVEYHVEIAAVNNVGVGKKYVSPPLTLEGILNQWCQYYIEVLCTVLNFLLFTRTEFVNSQCYIRA